jgi:hypothetical protein
VNRATDQISETVFSTPRSFGAWLWLLRFLLGLLIGQAVSSLLVTTEVIRYDHGYVVVLGISIGWDLLGWWRRFQQARVHVAPTGEAYIVFDRILFPSHRVPLDEVQVISPQPGLRLDIVEDFFRLSWRAMRHRDAYPAYPDPVQPMYEDMPIIDDTWLVFDTPHRTYRIRLPLAGMAATLDAAALAFPQALILSRRGDIRPGLDNLPMGDHLLNQDYLLERSRWRQRLWACLRIVLLPIILLGLQTIPKILAPNMQSDFAPPPEAHVAFLIVFACIMIAVALGVLSIDQGRWQLARALLDNAADPAKVMFDDGGWRRSTKSLNQIRLGTWVMVIGCLIIMWIPFFSLPVCFLAYSRTSRRPSKLFRMAYAAMIVSVSITVAATIAILFLKYTDK